MNEIGMYSFFVGLIIVSLSTVCVAVLRIIQLMRAKEVSSASHTIKTNDSQKVTVLIYAYDLHQVPRTLASLAKNRYKNVDIVVVYKNDTDKLAKKMRVPILHRRIQSSIHDALKAGYRKSKKGTIVMTLYAGDEVDAVFIKRSIALQKRTMWKALLYTKRTLDAPLTLIKISKGAGSFFWHAPRYAEVYHSNYFMKSNLLDPIKIPPIVGSVLGILFVVAVIVLGFITGDFMGMWYLWILVTSYYVLMVWLDIYFTPKDKQRLVLIAPSALFLVPVTSCIQAFSQFSKRK